MAQGFFPYPKGFLLLTEANGALTELSFSAAPGPHQDETPLLQACRQQLAEYFAGTRWHFSLPLAPKGTAFQKKVWQVLMQIPYGQTISYGQLACQVGCPKGAQAVGSANARNPLPILIPCHRVIGRDGSLTGYRGGLEVKAFLLALEQAHHKNASPNHIRQ